MRITLCIYLILLFSLFTIGDTISISNFFRDRGQISSSLSSFISSLSSSSNVLYSTYSSLASSITTITSSSTSSSSRRLEGSNCIKIETGKVPPYFACKGCKYDLAQQCLDDLRFNKTGSIPENCPSFTLPGYTSLPRCCPRFGVNKRETVLPQELDHNLYPLLSFSSSKPQLREINFDRSGRIINRKLMKQDHSYNLTNSIDYFDPSFLLSLNSSIYLSKEFLDYYNSVSSPNSNSRNLKLTPQAPNPKYHNVLDMLYKGAHYPLALACLNHLGCGNTQAYQDLLIECKTMCPLTDPRKYGGQVCLSWFNSSTRFIDLNYKVMFILIGVSTIFSMFF